MYYEIRIGIHFLTVDLLRKLGSGGLHVETAKEAVRTACDVGKAIHEKLRFTLAEEKRVKQQREEERNGDIGALADKMDLFTW